MHRRRRLFDEDGYFYIVDRSKDMYISGGENVYPAEVENVLFQMPRRAEAAVIGVHDDKWGEVGKAIVALKPGQTSPRPRSSSTAAPTWPVTRRHARSSLWRRCPAIPPGRW